MSCIFSDVSGHSVKSVSTAEEQVLHRPNSVVGEQEGLAATHDRDANILVMEAHVDKLLSVPETQSDRLSFPNLHATTEEEEEEEEEEEDDDDDEEGEEDDEEDDDEDGNGEEGIPVEEEEREDEKEDDAQLDVEEEVEDDPAQERCAFADEVGSISPLLLSCTVFYIYAYDVYCEVLFRA